MGTNNKAPVQGRFGRYPGYKPRPDALAGRLNINSPLSIFSSQLIVAAALKHPPNLKPLVSLTNSQFSILNSHFLKLSPRVLAQQRLATMGGY